MMIRELAYLPWPLHGYEEWLTYGTEVPRLWPGAPR